MKKFLAITLTLVLCLGLGVTALATDLPEGWTPADGARIPADGARTDVDPDASVPNPDDALAVEPTLADDIPEVVAAPIPAQYDAIITVDGKELDTTGIPGAPAGYVPMRLVTEAADGWVQYYPDEKLAFFFLEEQRINVHFDGMSVTLEFDTEPLEGVQGYLNPAGYTYLPVSFLQTLNNVTVDENLELDVNRWDIKTSLSDPMVQLSKSIEETCEMPAVSPVMEEMLTMLEFDMGNYTQLIAHAPMMNIQSATIFLAEVAEGKMDAAKKDFKAFQDQQISAFETYLQEPYEMAKAGQIVESPDGAHLMLIISEHNDKAIELFNAAYPAAE